MEKTKIALSNQTIQAAMPTGRGLTAHSNRILARKSRHPARPRRTVSIPRQTPEEDAVSSPKPPHKILNCPNDSTTINAKPT